MPRFPARLHVLLARDAAVGVVLRRGPSRAVCSILWDRARDRFQTGQWLKGRIYERRSDLSPDGRHLIYFAMNGHWGGETRGSWTAISVAPWLEAEVLLGKGDCWHGGGLFTSNRSYWLNDGWGHTPLRDLSDLKRDPTHVPAGRGFGGECPGVYYPRLLRDGWKLVETMHDVVVFEKPAAAGWLLRKFAHAEVGAPPGKGCYWDEHELEHPATKRTLPRAGWEWAEVDSGALVFAEGGCLFRSAVGRAGIGEPALLRDFNDLTFEKIPGPRARRRSRQRR